MEEVLFSRCKYEICSTIHALEDAILKLRHKSSPVATWMWRRNLTGPAARFLLDLPAILLPVPFAGQRLLGPELLTRLQVKGMSLHFLDNVLLLDLTLEAAKGIFQRFALLKLYFSQTKYTSQLDRYFSTPWGIVRCVT